MIFASLEKLVFFYMEIISIFRLLCEEKSSNSDIRLSAGLKIYRQLANIGERGCDRKLD